jgi:hypothetical protein
MRRRASRWVSIGVAGLVAALAGCAPSGPEAGTAPAAPTAGPTPTVALDPATVIGLWRTSFGPVKIEADETGSPSAIAGVWSYDRGGEAVVGYFQGALDGNVLRFDWHEPGPGLTGAGYLVFDARGESFDGRWWSRDQARQGEWTGRRVTADAAPATAPEPAPPADEGGDAEQAPAPPPEAI